MNEKICPMMKINCKEEKCAWYDEILEQCAIFTIADSLSDMVSIAEDDGINVNAVLCEE